MSPPESAEIHQGIALCDEVLTEYRRQWLAAESAASKKTAMAAIDRTLDHRLNFMARRDNQPS